MLAHVYSVGLCAMLRKVGATMRFEYSVRFLYYEVGVSFRQAHAVDYEYMH